MGKVGNVESVGKVGKVGNVENVGKAGMADNVGKVGKIGNVGKAGNAVGEAVGKVIVITNRKGGCGKSFTTASLGVGLARQGKKVLLLDTDNQHSLTISMGVKEPDKLPVSLTTIISDIIAERDIDPAAGIICHEEGVDLLPANNSLTGIELALATLIGRETILRQYIERVKPLYDYLLIDTCPTLDMLTVNALAAADSAIIPVTPKYLDAKGLELLLRSIADMREFINPNLSISGILLTMVDRRTNFTKQIISVIEQAYGESIRIFKEHIPHSIRAAETSATGKSIFSHDPGGKVAAAYESLVREVLGDASYESQVREVLGDVAYESPARDVIEDASYESLVKEVLEDA